MPARLPSEPGKNSLQFYVDLLATSGLRPVDRSARPFQTNALRRPTGVRWSTPAVRRRRRAEGLRPVRPAQGSARRPASRPARREELEALTRRKLRTRQDGPPRCRRCRAAGSVRVTARCGNRQGVFGHIRVLGGVEHDVCSAAGRLLRPAGDRRRPDASMTTASIAQSDMRVRALAELAFTMLSGLVSSKA